mmetsp:Transcript_116791/g.330425  ORF Transcript_116791/g.330425 Transcript_116791/m.330425 type:complete len:355 (+) Transcript_116791:209-1273(+)
MPPAWQPVSAAANHGLAHLAAARTPMALGGRLGGQANPDTRRVTISKTSVLIGRSSSAEAAGTPDMVLARGTRLGSSGPMLGSVRKICPGGATLSGGGDGRLGAPRIAVRIRTSRTISKISAMDRVGSERGGEQGARRAQAGRRVESRAWETRTWTRAAQGEVGRAGKGKMAMRVLPVARRRPAKIPLGLFGWVCGAGTDRPRQGRGMPWSESILAWKWSSTAVLRMRSMSRIARSSTSSGAKSLAIGRSRKGSKMMASALLIWKTRRADVRRGYNRLLPRLGAFGRHPRAVLSQSACSSRCWTTRRARRGTRTAKPPGATRHGRRRTSLGGVHRCPTGPRRTSYGGAKRGAST